MNRSLPVAVPLAFLVAALVGIVIERGIIRFLYGRPLETLLAPFGVSLILQQAVRSIFSPLNRSVASPDWMSGTILLGPLEVTLNRLVIVGFCIAVFALLWLALQRTRLGLEVRAVAQNRAMARAMGVRSARVDALTFGPVSYTHLDVYKRQLLGIASAHAADDAAVQATLAQLRDADFDGKAEQVETLATSNHPLSLIHI